MLKKGLIGLIHFYQKNLSPLKPACCRFYPTCSSYAVEALSRFGVLRGGLLVFFRLLRCQPLCRGGYDPVPEQFTFRRQRQKNRREKDASFICSKASHKGMRGA